MQSPIYLHFWAKTDQQADGSVVWHALPYHLLDVAAVMGVLLEMRPRMLQGGSRLLGLDEASTRRFLMALALLHDVGKFAWRFQAKAAECFPDDLGEYAPPTRGTRHTKDGSTLWKQRLSTSLGARLWGGDIDDLRNLMPAVFGHHGSPALPDDIADVEKDYRRVAIEAAEACMVALFDLLDVSPVTPTAPLNALRASWWVSGVLTLADWLGSQQAVFEYLPGTMGLEEYWQSAQAKARVVVRRCGLEPPVPAPLRPFSELTASTWTPSAMQQLTELISLPDGPLLFVIEDVTGAGKTEAAQMLVHRLIAAGRASGAFWAMPTQATANAMYKRQADAIDKLFVPGEIKPSLVLAHGQAHLHDGFRATVFTEVANGNMLPRTRLSEEELPSQVACTEFLADDRRAGMLASIGAGTIDQAIQGVLPSRFNTLRLVGLADKVLVLDEAHAYDAYLGEEAARLLEFQAALGGCAIVLSATLAAAQWRQLLRQWSIAATLKRRRSLSRRPIAPLSLPDRNASFPLLTMVSEYAGETSVHQHPCEAAAHSHRSLRVRTIRSVDAALDRIEAAVARGASVAWIRNTVDSCQQAAAMLRERGVEPIVFHARFAQGDRQRREQHVVNLLGKPHKKEPQREVGRQGKVLLATQVVEQSLDLDVDFLISDLAPIDLLIQRAGRLWRHPIRDERRRAMGLEFEMLVLCPDPRGEITKDWPNEVLPGTGSVYKAAHYLWRTACLLDDVAAISSPGEIGDASAVRALISAVYDDEGIDDVPEVLHPRVIRSEGRDGEAASIANLLLLAVESGYLDERIGDSREVRAPTRLSDDQTTVRLARILPGGALVPWEPDGDRSLRHRWALSEVRLRKDRVPPNAACLSNFTSAVARARVDMGRWDQEIPIVPMERAGDDSWLGAVQRAGGVTWLKYTEQEGVAWGDPPA